MQDSDSSHTPSFRKRFLKNKTGVFGFCIIIITCLVALFAYQLAPDNTPHADRQTIEIQAKNPGYQQLFLVLPKKSTAIKSAFGRFFSGAPAIDEYLPINSYRISGNQIRVDYHVDDDTSIVKTFDIKTITQNKTNNISENIITRHYYLGTDGMGRDLLSRMIIGSRVSLSVGLMAVLIALLMGVTLGAVAGYFGGFADGLIGILINIFLSMPSLLMVFAFTIAMGKGFWQIFLAVGLTSWVGLARLVRAEVMRCRAMEFVAAAKTMGLGSARIIFRHILPNIAGSIIVMATGIFASAIMIEAGLSFLGLGVQPPEPSWGSIIKENYTFLITHKPMLAIAPGLAIMLLVLSFNLVGNALRDALDVRSH